jgi:hypothetical protein
LYLISPSDAVFQLLASSSWLKQFQDDLVFQSFDLKTLKYTYCKNYTLSVTWDAPAPGQAPKYLLNLGTISDSDIDNEAPPQLQESLTRKQKNPHWRITKLLENSLNEHKDWIMFVQVYYIHVTYQFCLFSRLILFSDQRLYIKHYHSWYV